MATLFWGTLAAVVAQRVFENFRMVMPGQVYRSAQLSPESLEEHIRGYHLRTIIDLRGRHPGEPWYEAERALADRFGLQYFDLPLDSFFPPTEKELAQIIEILKTCPKPVLIHCHSGIDRTGTVSSICFLAMEDGPEALQKAQEQLRLFGGYLPWGWGKAAANHVAFLNLYRSWLADHGYTHTSARFREWVFQVYLTLPEYRHWQAQGMGQIPPG